MKTVFSKVYIIKLVIALIIIIILVSILQAVLSSRGKSHELTVDVSNTNDVSHPVESISNSETETVKESVEPIVAEMSVSTEARYRGSRSNVIVVATYQVPGDLEPVRNYFAENGIDLQIVKRGKWYYLETVETFGSVNKAGSEGYRMKEQIKKIGGGYKAPSGYESFGTKPFQDVYGKKIK